MIFFDIGNTLEDETSAVEWRSNLAVSMVSKFGIEISREHFQQELRISSARRVPSAFRATIERLSPNEEAYATILKECVWRKDLLKLRGGAQELVATLSRCFRLGIIANQSEGAKQRFSRYGILNSFSTVVSSHDVGVKKPDSRIFEIALEQSGENPSDSFMVGDRLDNDIGPAKRMGLKTVRVLGCYNDSQLPIDDFEKPDFTVCELADLEHVFSNRLLH